MNSNVRSAYLYHISAKNYHLMRSEIMWIEELRVTKSIKQTAHDYVYGIYWWMLSNSVEINHMQSLRIYASKARIKLLLKDYE